MEFRKTSAALLSAVLFPLGAHATEFNYSYVDLTVTSAELETDSGDVESDRYSVLWSHDFGQDYWEFSPSLYLQVGLGREEVDKIDDLSTDGDLEITSTSALIGFHDLIHDQLSYFVGLGWTGRFFSGDFSDDATDDFFDPQKLVSYEAGGGLRYKPLSYLELKGSLFYTGFDTSRFFLDVDDDIVFDLSVLFHPNRAFAIGVGYKIGVDVFNDMSLTLRYKL